MQVFYTAKNYAGETKSGELKVKDERDLANQLRLDGFVLTSFKEIKEETENKTEAKLLNRLFGIPISEKMMFARNLSVMISSGLPLSRALINLTDQTQNKRFKKVLKNIYEDLQTGSTLSDGMAKYPAIFDELFVNMIRVGESGGNLEEVLQILAEQLEKEHDLTQKVKGAMVYPTVILVAMVLIGIVMMIYVVPELVSVFGELNANLPTSTKFIIATSNFMRNDWMFLLPGLVVLVFALKLFSTTASGKRTAAFLTVNIPIMRDIVIKLNCARFARIYSSLIKSGLPVVETLKILSRTLTNFYYQEALQKAADNVQKGIPLSKIIYEEKKIFPVLVPQMIEVGEETGKTEDILLKLAEFYEGEVNQLTKNMSSIIEPVLMLIIGSAVGFFAISILQPIYSVMQNIN